MKGLVSGSGICFQECGWRAWTRGSASLQRDMLPHVRALPWRSQFCRCTALVFREGLIRVTVEPAFARLRRSDDWMASRVCVLARMLVRRAIAAKRDAAFLTGSQVDPGGANLDTFRALEALRLLDRRDRIDVRATFFGHHEFISWKILGGTGAGAVFGGGAEGGGDALGIGFDSSVDMMRSLAITRQCRESGVEGAAGHRMPTF